MNNTTNSGDRMNVNPTGPRSGRFGYIKLYVLGALMGAIAVLVGSGIFGLSFEVSLLGGVALAAMALIWVPGFLKQRDSAGTESR